MKYNLGKFSSVPELLQKIIQNNILLYFVVFLLAVRIVSAVAFINFPQNLFFADITKAALESFTNQARQSLGLDPLKSNPKLDLAAQLKAENMLSNDYFAHTSPTGITPWHWFSEAGYKYKYAGENLAVGFYDSQEVYQAWLNSPSHKANMLNPNYKETGIAVAKGFGDSNAIVVVQLFGSPQIQTVPAAIQPVPVKPAPKPENSLNVNNKEDNVEKQAVLSQETQAEQQKEQPNFILYNYDALLQDIIYGVSLVVIGILFALIFFNAANFRKELAFRSVIIIILLSLAALLNKEVMASVIPHQIII